MFNDEDWLSIRPSHLPLYSNDQYLIKLDGTEVKTRTYNSDCDYLGTIYSKPLLEDLEILAKHRQQLNKG